MPDQANYENSLQNESVRAPAYMEAAVNAELGTDTEVYLHVSIPDGQAYIVPLLPPPYTRAGHTLGTKSLEIGHPDRETHQEVGCSCGWVATIAKRPGAAEAWFDSHVDGALETAARRDIEDQAAAEFRPRSDEAADLRVGSGLHDRYLLLKGEPIGAIWKAGWAERLVDAVRQMELDPPEDWEATPEMEAALASDLMDIPINEAHFAASEDPYGEIAAVLLGKGWRR